MRAPDTRVKPRYSLAVLATATILLAATAEAAAQSGGRIPIDPPMTPTSQPTPPPKLSPTGTFHDGGLPEVRDHRPPPIVRDHRTRIRDHRTQRAPVPGGGGVTVTYVPRKPKAQPGYNPVPGSHY
jgi:hypothetical protein